MKTSEECDKVAASLVAVQGEMHLLGKNKKGHNYKYTELPDVVEALRDPLKKHSLAVAQGVIYCDDEMRLETTLFHSSGQWLKVQCPMLVEKGRMSAMQSLGSAMTYARRYSLLSLFNIGCEDDDGLGGPEKKKQPPANPPQDPIKTKKDLLAQQVGEALNKATGGNDDRKAYLKGLYKFDTPAELKTKDPEEMLYIRDELRGWKPEAVDKSMQKDESERAGL